MFHLFLILISFGFLAFLVLSHEPERVIGRSGSSRIALMAGLGVLGLYVFILLLIGIGKMAGGDMTGIAHLFMATLVAGMAYLAYRCPCESGVVLLLLGILSGFVFLQISIAQPVSIQISSFILGSVPFLLAGLFIIASGWLSRFNLSLKG
jgi:peptidoglycan/LPS O-acetylase OafA/YrhL